MCTRIPRGASYMCRAPVLPPRVSVYDLDTLKPWARSPTPTRAARRWTPSRGHGFASSKPGGDVGHQDAGAPSRPSTCRAARTAFSSIPFNQRVWVFSHRAPNATIIDTKDGSVVGTLDLGGAPEQAVTDGKGHM